jgi:DNA-binding NtrC family response regulator
MLLAQIFADDIRALRQGATGPASGSDRERTVRLADRAARSLVPILIQGEAGSGAQSLACAIHECGDRKQRPFIRLHAGDLTEPNADPDAALSRRLQDANGGTLFIQDVDRLTAQAQNRLFEVASQQDTAPRLPRRSARPDVRIIASTDFDLGEKVRQGHFREDLFYRLQALPISLRPLRAQREAIAEWANLFLKRFAADEGKKVKGLSAEAATLLARYDWPGNLRQLENAVFRAVILVEGYFLTPAEFPQVAAHVQGFRVEIPPVPHAMSLAPVRDITPAEKHDPHVLPLVSETGEMRTLAELEESASRFALVHYQGHLSAISRRLGIGRSTLYRKLKELGLDDEAA